MRQWQEHAVSVFEPGENDLQRPGDLGEHLSARSAVAVRVGRQMDESSRRRRSADSDE
jgi:hypothetical protein